MAALTRKKRGEIAARRIVNVLKAQGVANLRTLEQKIADAGPNPQRVQPHILTPVKTALVKSGRIVQLDHGNAQWLQLAAAAHGTGVGSLISDTDPQATARKWSQWRDGAEPEVIDCAPPPLLAKKLEQAAELGAELAVIDTPPHADSMSAAACRIADLILIPCRPRAFDLDAIETTADLVKASGKPAFVVFTAGPQRAIHLYREAAEIVAGFGLSVAPLVMSERAAYHHATGAGKTAPEIEPDGRAAEEVAALWAWVRQRANVSTRQRANKEAAA